MTQLVSRYYKQMGFKIRKTFCEEVNSLFFIKTQGRQGFCSF